MGVALTEPMGPLANASTSNLACSISKYICNLFSENGLEIVGVPIKAVKSTRFLGVIDEDLT